MNVKNKKTCMSLKTIGQVISFFVDVTLLYIFLYSLSFYGKGADATDSARISLTTGVFGVLFLTKICLIDNGFEHVSKGEI